MQLFFSALFVYVALISLRVIDREVAESFFLPVSSYVDTINPIELKLFTFDTERRAIARGQRLFFVPFAIIVPSLTVALIFSPVFETFIKYATVGRFSKALFAFGVAFSVVRTGLSLSFL